MHDVRPYKTVFIVAFVSIRSFARFKTTTFYILVYSDVSSPHSVGPSGFILLNCPHNLKLRPVEYKEALLSGPVPYPRSAKVQCVGDSV
jgi:hypothetical protein